MSGIPGVRSWAIAICVLVFGCSGATALQAPFHSGRYGDYAEKSHQYTHSGKCATSFMPNAVPQERQPAQGVEPSYRNDDQTIAAVGVTVPPLQITPLIVSGPIHNRVDLVFFSDGYVEDENEKFLQDAMRLARDISSNQTFNTVKPLMNFWAAFTPSNESGVGAGGIPKDTPFGLYRDGTELRAVYYSHPEVARAACDSLGDQCDYPILLGNDPYYGGLGGDFTVITASLKNGPLVLRHELGHSIIEIGEEYDGGFAYFGPNAAHDTSQLIPWENWLSGKDKDARKAPRVERSVMPMQAYPWTMLNTTIPWSIKFTSSGLYSRHLVRFSLSGLPEKSDLVVHLDGTDLEWAPDSTIGLDRWHYDIHREGGLPLGEHQVTFNLLNGDREGIAQLCSVEILEFGNEDEFVSTPGYYGLYPTYSDANTTSFRPTNEDCLMRVVTTPNFCKVCTEGLWLSLLRRVNLIEGIEGTCEKHADAWANVIEVKLIPLAQLRTDAISAAESYTITWAKEGEIIHELTNQTRIEVNSSNAIGRYTVNVRFSTEEVRKESELLSSVQNYDIVEACGTDRSQE